MISYIDLVLGKNLIIRINGKLDIVWIIEKNWNLCYGIKWGVLYMLNKCFVLSCRVSVEV